MSALLFTLLSAILLLLAYPLPNLTWLAWIALVPFLHALTRAEPACPDAVGAAGRRLSRAWWLGYLHGLVFYGGLVSWVAHVRHIGGAVVWLGYSALVAYLALYHAVFAWGLAWYYRASRDTPPRAWLAHPVTRCLAISSWWVVLEWLRAHLLTGFGWGLLAYTQSAHPMLIQTADLWGAYGVSWVVVAVNVAAGQLLRPQPWQRKLQVAVTTGLLMAAVIGYGAWRLRQPLGDQTLRVAVVQGNIPQDQKWDAVFQDAILERYAALTRDAAAQQPDLIVWPETAFPGLFPLEERLAQRLQALAREVGWPLLVGAPTTTRNLADPAMWNSAVLLGADGRVITQYHKLRLVPFGEFIPFERQLPWLRQAVVTGDFDPGNETTVFRLPTQHSVLSPQSSASAAFSVLICFEDIFPELSRQFVERGARLLIVITNDAWFGQTAAPAQHLQASILRAVECRVPVVRSANTGISGFIDVRGRVTRLVVDDIGEPLMIAGTALEEVHLAPPGQRTTYQRWGDWWLGSCLLMVFGGAWVISKTERKYGTLSHEVTVP